MNANYFYDLMLSHKEIVNKSGRQYIGYSDGIINITEKGADNIYYNISRDKRVIKINAISGDIDILTLDDLKGDKYELFNILKQYKTFYYLFDESTQQKVFNNISLITEKIMEKGWDKDSGITYIMHTINKFGNTDSLYYVASNGVRVNIRTVKSLCFENKTRKLFSVPCLPFNKKISDWSGLYIGLEYSQLDKSTFDIYRACDAALDEFKNICNEVDVKGRVKECKMFAPINL